MRFKEIVGWHDPKDSTPLWREMLRFSQFSTKWVFEDVFANYGRPLKSDLIFAQWNHLGDFNQINGDERRTQPRELWGKDEDYTWYRTNSPGSEALVCSAATDPGRRGRGPASGGTAGR